MTNRRDFIKAASGVGMTERSVLKDGASVEVPDFTRDAWKTAQPLGLVEV